MINLVRGSVRVVYFLVNLLFVCAVLNFNEKTDASRPVYKVSVGFVYCEPEELLEAEQEVVNKLNKEFKTENYKLVLDLKLYRLNANDNTISLSLAVCEKLMASEPLYAVVIGKTDCIRVSTSGANSSTTSMLSSPQQHDSYVNTLSAISFTCGYYQIPVVDIYNRDADFSDNNIYSTYIRLSPPYFHQASAWIELVKKFEWKSVNLVHADDAEGKMLAARLQYLADQQEIKIVAEVEYSSGSNNLKPVIDKLIQSTSKVFLLQARETDAEIILNIAQENDLFSVGNVWIVSERILLNSNMTKSKQGLLMVKYNEEIDLVYNAFAMLKHAFENLNVNYLKKPSADCAENGLEWDLGRRIYEEIVFNIHFYYGKELEFDEDGDRISSRYDIINVGKVQLVSVGEIKYDSKTLLVDLNASKILWPGETHTKPEGTKWSKKFRIVTIEEKPFIFKIPKPFNRKCNQIMNNSIECPWMHDNITEFYCCYGYCIDLIKTLAVKLKIEYEMYLVPDGAYGVLEKNAWNGLMGELLSERADMILAPFTINPERALYVDFSKPFKYQGITILVKRKGAESNLVSFLQPFKDGLWVMVLLSVHVVALVLYLLDRFSPFGRFKLSKTENTEEDALNLSRSLWFTWGVLLNSGIGEGTPRSFSARVLGMVWAGFAMIMVASYTANLAAFLVLDRPKASITGINDARLRNPSENYSYATVKGSAVERYFKRQVELSTMYRTMENKNYKTVEEAIDGLRLGKIQAFIWDSVRLEYEARKSCDFITTGELFGRSSYALALKKGNPWLSKLSLEILSLHENGYMEDLDEEWILLNNSGCQNRDSSPSTLGLTNMAGVFMLVAGGIIVGVFLIFIEIAYKKRKDKKVREHDLSRNAFATWRKNVEKRKLRTARDSIDITSRISHPHHHHHHADANGENIHLEALNTAGSSSGRPPNLNLIYNKPKSTTLVKPSNLKMAGASSTMDTMKPSTFNPTKNANVNKYKYKLNNSYGLMARGTNAPLKPTTLKEKSSPEQVPHETTTTALSSSSANLINKLNPNKKLVKSARISD